MKHPTSKQFDRVIKRFEKILPYASKAENLNFLAFKCTLPKNNDCVRNCVGGWYAAANKRRMAIKMLGGDYIGFSSGSKLMANDLGFGGDEQLTNWALENPKVWGNTSGRFMFSSSIAWSNTKTMKGVV